jgi:hypothetical protein
MYCIVFLLTGEMLEIFYPGTAEDTEERLKYFFQAGKSMQYIQHTVIHIYIYTMQ